MATQLKVPRMVLNKYNVQKQYEKEQKERYYQPADAVGQTMGAYYRVTPDVATRNINSGNHPTKGTSKDATVQKNLKEGKNKNTKRAKQLYNKQKDRSNSKWMGQKAYNNLHANEINQEQEELLQILEDPEIERRLAIEESQVMPVIRQRTALDDDMAHADRVAYPWKYYDQETLDKIRLAGNEASRMWGGYVLGENATPEQILSNYDNANYVASINRMPIEMMLGNGALSAYNNVRRLGGIYKGLNNVASIGNRFYNTAYKVGDFMFSPRGIATQSALLGGLSAAANNQGASDDQLYWKIGLGATSGLALGLGTNKFMTGKWFGPSSKDISDASEAALGIRNEFRNAQYAYNKANTLSNETEKEKAYEAMENALKNWNSHKNYSVGISPKRQVFRPIEYNNIAELSTNRLYPHFSNRFNTLRILLGGGIGAGLGIWWGSSNNTGSAYNGNSSNLPPLTNVYDSTQQGSVHVDSTGKSNLYNPGDTMQPEYDYGTGSTPQNDEKPKSSKSGQGNEKSKQDSTPKNPPSYKKPLVWADEE